jgi:hypothetical protein
MTLFSCEGGRLILPARELLLASREDGGNLCVLPPREVWERSELTRLELTLWSFLVAAAGRAMLDVLPQLEGGCINYWDAGNWRLNDQADPPGPKTAREFRSLHLHLLGRSPRASNPAWRWGEAPVFPTFAERHTWAVRFERLNATECRDVVARVELLLRDRYDVPAHQIAPWTSCPECGYPVALVPGREQCLCGSIERPTHLPRERGE